VKLGLSEAGVFFRNILTTILEVAEQKAAEYLVIVLEAGKRCIGNFAWTWYEVGLLIAFVAMEVNLDGQIVKLLSQRRRDHGDNNNGVCHVTLK
jgi:hypothetical protein